MASLLPRPVLPAAAAASTSSSSRCRYRTATSSSARGWSNCQGWRLRHRVWAAHAADQQGGVQQQQQQENEDDVVDSNVLPYCSINRKEKKTIGEMEQEFLSRRCRPAFYYDKKAVISNEVFDNLKEELMWEGSSVVMLNDSEFVIAFAGLAPSYYVHPMQVTLEAQFLRQHISIIKKREVKSYKKVQDAVFIVKSLVIT
uniref:Uncharacterized protein n=1 Tax=Oryza glumipatula TaxID=40148 RepID=A0A0E0ATU0_9ORYZ